MRIPTKKPTSKIALRPSDFRIGFELEFRSKVLVRRYGDPCRFCDGTGKPRKRIKIRGRTLAAVGEVGGDGPLWELRTHPVCYTEFEDCLRKAFRILEYFEASAGKRCGLHVNVSCKKRSVHGNLDPLRLTKFLDTSKLSRLFGRQKLETCKSPVDTRPFALFDFYTRNLGEGDRHLAINFLPYHLTPKKTSRVEFRFLGGRAYHRKPDLCIKVVKAIVRSMTKSYRK